MGKTPTSSSGVAKKAEGHMFLEPGIDPLFSEGIEMLRATQSGVNAGTGNAMGVYNSWITDQLSSTLNASVGSGGRTRRQKKEAETTKHQKHLSDYFSSTKQVAGVVIDEPSTVALSKHTPEKAKKRRTMGKSTDEQTKRLVTKPRSLRRKLQ
jgi:hypothetical protein